MADLATEVALAIYQAWAREPDPDAAFRRFKRLKPSIRKQFDREASAAIRVCEAYFTGARAS